MRIENVFFQEVSFKYPLALIELAKNKGVVFCSERDGHFQLEKGRFIDLVYSMPYHFDKYKISLNIYQSSFDGKFTSSILINKSIGVHLGFYDNRLNATIAAAKKAFELRERQLRNEKQAS